MPLAFGLYKTRARVLQRSRGALLDDEQWADCIHFVAYLYFYITCTVTVLFSILVIIVDIMKRDIVH